MITTDCLPHDRIEFARTEIGEIADLLDLPWATKRVARVVDTRVGLEVQVGPYVGRLVVPGKVVIDVREPYPGTVAACLELSKSGRRAASQGSPPGAVHVAPWTALAESFATSLSSYVMHGIERQYLPQLITTSRPRGHVEVGLTAQKVFSRGREDKIICRPRVLSDDTPLNRALVAGAARAEQILIRDGSANCLRVLRSVAPAMSGVRRDTAPDVFAARRQIELLREDHRDLLSLAQLLVEGVPTLPPSERFDDVFPMTAWLNVERIFEEAIFAATRQIVGDRGRVHAGTGDATTLFAGQLEGESEPVAKSADPDIVVRHAAGTLLLDAKYRRHLADFTEDELYQLMAHAGAYRASAAALVAPARPGRAAEEKWLGRDRSGIAYYAISVDPADPAQIFQALQAWLNRQVRQP
jgi:5-methylcytosine-specific restriction endonuclease McrBC regulatory subunit McrC